MKTLTVFTPTYNRAHLLRRLYESLVTQSCQDFEWLVIDDGSTDFTRQLVESFIAEGRIPVRYIYKENGGLYTGYNVAYANIATELCVCIDSDDFMPDDAVEIIVNTWREKVPTVWPASSDSTVTSTPCSPSEAGFPKDSERCIFLTCTPAISIAATPKW